MYRYEPPKKKGKTTSILVALLGAGGLLFLLSVFAKGFTGLLQVGAIGFLGAAVLVFVRYGVRRYLYEIRAMGGGAYDFIVTEVTGKQSVTVTRLSLSRLLSVTPKEEKRERAGKSYYYTVDPWARGVTVLRFEDEINAGGTVDIFLSPDERLLAILREFETKNKNGSV